MFVQTTPKKVVGGRSHNRGGTEAAALVFSICGSMKRQPVSSSPH